MSEEYLDVQRLVVRPALEEQLASARRKGRSVGRVWRCWTGC